MNGESRLELAAAAAARRCAADPALVNAAVVFLNNLAQHATSCQQVFDLAKAVRRCARHEGPASQFVLAAYHKLTQEAKCLIN
jgi:hypothetical protein